MKKVMQALCLSALFMGFSATAFSQQEAAPAGSPMGVKKERKVVKESNATNEAENVMGSKRKVRTNAIQTSNGSAMGAKKAAKGTK